MVATPPSQRASDQYEVDDSYKEIESLVSEPKPEQDLSLIHI